MQASLSFDPFRFEPATGRLWRGPQELNLTPKAAAVLRALLDHAGELVPKQTLFSSVWHDCVVSDDALVACVQELRRALADDPRQPRFIETRYRRGYRFLPSVTAVSPGPTSSNCPTVAVLPFENAIAQDIVTALSKHRSMRVVARTPADYIVEGSVGKAGTRMRIRARLVEMRSGGYVWAEKYDLDIDAMFELQDQVVASIAARVEHEVASKDPGRGPRGSNYSAESA
jgi:DNA-binding winged helix-turn-helix (wHTH) protein